MTDTPDPTTPQPPTPQPSAAQPPAAPRWVDPAKLLYRAPFREAAIPAALALGFTWIAVLAINIVYLVRDALWSIHDGPEYFGRALGNFAEGAFLEPLLFVLGAGALLVFVLPILPSAKLPLVMARAALAGIGGFVLLSVAGLIEAVSEALRFGFSFGYFVNDWIGYPVVVAFDFTALLVIGAVLTWWWRSRKPAPAS